MFGKRKHSKAIGIDGLGNHNDYELLTKQLFETPLHNVQHEEIEIPDPDSGLAKAADLETCIWAFSYFRGFPDYVHKFRELGEPHTLGPWCLEQRREPYASMAGIDDGPIIGLRYRVYYNSCRTGDLEIVPGFSFTDLPENVKPVSLYIELNNASRMPYRHVFNLLNICAGHLDRHKQEVGVTSRAEAVSKALQEAMWESVRDDCIVNPLLFEFHGLVEISE